MNLEPLIAANRRQLNSDLRSAGHLVSREEARFLVRTYYQMQEDRIRAAAQARSLNKSGQPSDLISWLGLQSDGLEQSIKIALDAFSANHPVGAWMRQIDGIGPVIAAGFLAEIDITRCDTAGNLWSFAGLSPLSKWEKGQKRPWNADLKVLCYKAGESFVKVCNKDGAYYGNLYKAQKLKITEANALKTYAAACAEILATKRLGKDTEAYKHYSVGLLPPAHVHARARRYAVKVFLSHLWEVWRKHEGLSAPLPYAIQHLGHAHYLPPPHEIGEE